MTNEEYIKSFRPLTEKELQQGKSSLCIYGTKTPMPWTTIFARIESGQPIEEIAKQYGHGRKIALWAQHYSITKPKPQYEELVTKTAETRQEIQHIANEDPEVALTLLQRVNEVAPNFEQNVSIFADKLVKRAITKLDDQYIEAADLSSLANAVQKVTDTVGVTQRHASGVNINTGDIQVTGFDFVLDAPPPTDTVIDVTTEDD